MLHEGLAEDEAGHLRGWFIVQQPVERVIGGFDLRAVLLGAVDCRGRLAIVSAKIRTHEYTAGICIAERSVTVRPAEVGLNRKEYSLDSWWLLA